MVERIIDYDRGVIINNEPITGIDVFMYVDEPGVYLNAHGVAVPVALAKAAGYNIEENAKKKIIKDRMRAAKDAIEADMKGEDDNSAECISLDGGYSLRGLGLGRYLLKDPDGNVLTPTPLAKEHAEAIAKLLMQKDIAPVDAKAK